MNVLVVPIILLMAGPSIEEQLDFLFDHRVVATKRPLVLAHKGSSGVYPEHTQAAYKQGIEDGADAIECDVILTRDLIPICNLKLGLALSTNIAEIPEFAARKTSYSQHGLKAEDYYALDFDLEELRRVKRVQSNEVRNQEYNGEFGIVTLAEYITTAKGANRTIIIYPELKHPSTHNAILGSRGVTKRMEDIVLKVLMSEGYTEKDDPCFIQCFEEDSLIYLECKTDLPLVMLIGNDIPDDKLTYWGAKFYGVGCSKEQIHRVWTPENGYKNWISGSTDFVEKAHNAGLKVHVYAFRNEDKYLAWDYQQDAVLEYDDYLKLGVDGYFADFPATLVRKLDTIYDVCPRSGSPSLGINVSFFVVAAFVWQIG